MALLKCKMCGGELEINVGENVAVCEYCGSKQTVPNVDDEKKMTMFGRAHRLRFACEFDKASGVYENIIADFPEEAEAYWGLVLCKYGVEYVDDPATGKKVPTCHRASFESVDDDVNYEQTLENALPVARAVYRDEARRIEELRKGIVEVSQREEPYDIFICYKETAEDGTRSADSVIAQEAYDALSEKGYRVFFSRITLEEKLGVEYEPYIFTALNSAKIMLVFGTDYEHFNAVWVKNEWGRFLQLMAKGEKKTLIPCYRDMNAYDMPKEFQRLQAQDMGKLGAMQDLIRGIEKILPRERESERVRVRENPSLHDGDVLGVMCDRLMRRVYMYLEDGDWKNADAYCEKVLDIMPESGEAYLGKLMAEMRCGKREMLASGTERFNERANYQKALQFGSDELKKELQGYHGERIYQKAVGILTNALTERDFKEAERLFRLIPGHKDADKKAEEAAGGWQKRIKEAYDCFSIWKESKTGEDKLRGRQIEAAALEDEKNVLKMQINEYPDLINKAADLSAQKEKAEVEIKTLRERTAELEREHASLGMFAGKQKKAVKEMLDSLTLELREKERDFETRLLPSYNAAKREYENGKTPEKCEAEIMKIDERLARLAEMTAEEEKRKAEEEERKAAVGMTPAEAEVKMLSDRYSEIFADDTAVLTEVVNNEAMLTILVKNETIKRAIINKIKDFTLSQRVILGLHNIGNRFSFGKREWRILAIDENRGLIISADMVKFDKYHENTKSITWENCTLRRWLNDEFYNGEFSQAEKEMILQTNVSADKNPYYKRINPGNNTTDKVFLLSINEVKKYFVSGRDRRISVCWWLRSPGNSTDSAAYIAHGGQIRIIGDYVGDEEKGIRPALWIKI